MINNKYNWDDIKDDNNDDSYSEKNPYTTRHDFFRPDEIVPEDAEEEGDIRIIDESGEDYLYPSSYFVPIKVPQTLEESLLKAS